MFTSPLSLLLAFEDLPEPRQDAKVQHRLHEMIFVAICAAVANCDHWTEIEDWAESNIDFLAGGLDR